MANTVFQHKRSGTPTNVPSSLELGELAINYADGLIFYKNTTGQIVSISGGGGGNFFGTVNANGTLVVADTPSDVLNLVAGNNVTFGVDAVNDIITINSAGGDVSAPFDAANAAFLAANSAFANGNTNFGVTVSAFGTANNGWLQANTARTHANSAFGTANSAFNKANGAVQTGFTSVVANGNTITAITNTSTLTIIAGTNISINSNTENNSLTISSSGSSPGGGLSFTSNVGNGSANTFNIDHNLNTLVVIPAVRERSTGYYVYPDMKVTSPNNIVLEFVSIPTANQYLLIVLGA